MVDHSTSRRTLLAGTLGGSALGGLMLGPAGAAGAVEGVTVPSDPAASFFLAVDGIPGESIDDRFPNTIDVLDWSWGVVNTISPTHTGGGAGKSRPQPFVFVAHTSVASPKLFLACAKGTHIKSATLSARKVQATKPFLTVKLENLFVTSYHVAPGPVDALPLDVVQLEYGAVTVTYTLQNPDGGVGKSVSAGFDFLHNKVT